MCTCVACTRSFTNGWQFVYGHHLVLKARPGLRNLDKMKAAWGVRVPLNSYFPDLEQRIMPFAFSSPSPPIAIPNPSTPSIQTFWNLMCKNQIVPEGGQGLVLTLLAWTKFKNVSLHCWQKLPGAEGMGTIIVRGIKSCFLSLLCCERSVLSHPCFGSHNKPQAPVTPLWPWHCDCSLKFPDSTKPRMS